LPRHVLHEPYFNPSTFIPDQECLASESARRHTLDRRHVRLGNQLGAAQLTLTLRALLGQDMTGEGLLVLEASGGFLEPLGSSALGFHLRHFLKLRILFLSKTIVPLNDKSPADAGDPSQDQVHFFLRGATIRSEEHTSELQSRENLVCRLL